MGVPEIARRFIGGAWQTGVAEDPSGGSQTLEEVLTAGADAGGKTPTNLGGFVLDGVTADGDFNGANLINAPNVPIAGEPYPLTLDMGGNVIANVAAINGTGDDWDTDGGNLYVYGVHATADVVIGADLDHDGTGVGFYGTPPAACPEVPATPIPQDIVDALVTLGLVTQASP